MEREPEYTDVMVDLETTGTQPDRTAILQIAAVKFNLQSGDVSPVFFNRCLTIPKHRFWDQDTANWWNKKPAVLKEILGKAEDYRTVMKDYFTFIAQTPSLRFWSKPTTFDFMFLASYLSDEGLSNPCHYTQATDMRSYLHGLYDPLEVPEKEVAAGIPFNGPAHNALFDTLHQLKLLFALRDRALAARNRRAGQIDPNAAEAEIVHQS